VLNRKTIDAKKLIFLAALSFLLLRNIPLCLLMPPWAHGDEIGHFDYILKLDRGHLPVHSDMIEPQTWALHKVHYDMRYSIDSRIGERNLIKLDSIAQYSYEAHQPPLPYAVMALVRKAFLLFQPSLLVQLKLLRIVSLFAVVLGLWVIYSGLTAVGIKALYFYSPLLFIPLLVKDMFFSLNTDNFSFLFGSIAVAGVIRLFKNPVSAKNWIWLSAGTVLALWTKIPNAFLLAVWPAVLWLLRRKFPDKKVFKSFLLFFLMVLVLSSPWYIYNSLRFQSPFFAASGLPYPMEAPTPFSWSALTHFTGSFFTTLFRGEFVWNGAHFQILGASAAKIILFFAPLLIFALGFSCLFFAFDKRRPFLSKALILGTGIALTAFCTAFFVVGKAPFYLARYSYAALYGYMLVFAAGWKRLIPKSDAVLALPMAGLLIYQVFYTAAMLTRIL
jgi:hypothetical protein